MSVLAISLFFCYDILEGGDCMKQKGIPKETLTIANIRRDLRRRLCKSWVLSALYVFLMAMEIYLFHLEPSLLFEDAGSRYGMPGWVYLLIFPLVSYLLVKETVLLSCGFRRVPYIVTDRLVSSEGDSYYSSHSWRTAWCTLHFNCYGDYSVPEKNYSWSKQYAMSAQGVDNLAFEGGEYYLVLSRPHSGKILLAYNAELFELESKKVEEIS